MKRNARPSSAPFNRLLVATLALLAFAGSIGVATVWLRHQISEVARSNKQIQARTAEVERRIAETNAQTAVALTPQTLINQNVRLGLKLVSPVEEQTIRIDADVTSLLAANNANADAFRRIVLRATAPASENNFAPAAVITPVPR